MTQGEGPLYEARLMLCLNTLVHLWWLVTTNTFEILLSDTDLISRAITICIAGGGTEKLQGGCNKNFMLCHVKYIIFVVIFSLW